MSENTKKKNLVGYLKENLFCFLFLGIILFCVIIYVDYSNAFLVHFPINIEFWSSLISAVIGSTVAIFGVYWTLDEENKKREEDLKNSHKPYLRYYISIGVYPYRSVDQNRRTAILDYSLSNSDSSGERFVIFPLDVENIGLGHAFITKVKAEIGDKEFNAEEVFREKIIKKDENSVFFIKVSGINNEEELKNLKIKIEYKSLVGEIGTDTLSISIAKGKLQCFDGNFVKGTDSFEALEKYFKKYEIIKDTDREKYQKTIKKALQKGYIVKELAYKEKQP